MRTPHKITIKLRTDNSAFDMHEGGEIAKQLRSIARTFADNEAIHFGNGNSVRRILDSHGNTCGSVKVKAIK